MSRDARLHILELIESGKITAEEGIRLLNALTGDAPAEAEPVPPAPEPSSKAPGSAPPELGYWRGWWRFPLAVGVIITLLGGGLMYWALLATDFRLTLWLMLASCPFALGVVVLALSFASRSAKWIHIRVNSRERLIALSFPLPLRLAAWFLRTFEPRLPALQRTGVDELILALGDSTSPHRPLYVEVNDGDAGEQVQVYIG